MRRMLILFVVVLVAVACRSGDDATGETATPSAGGPFPASVGAASVDADGVDTGSVDAEPATDRPSTPPTTNRPAAPPFPADLEWLNTARPLALPQLAGKIVVLISGRMDASIAFT